MLNPVIDVINLINEFGTRATLRSVTSDYDSGTGDPINSYTEKNIIVIPYSLDKMERIQNPTTLTQQTINITTKQSDEAKINDDIIIGSSTYTLRQIIEQPTFSHSPSGLNNDIALVAFRAQLKQTSA